jgi:hypothetical protein
MNYVENLRSTQLRKLFKIFKSSITQSLNIFKEREGLHFEFICFCWVWILEENLNWAGPTCQRPISFLPPRPSNRTCVTCHRASHHRRTNHCRSPPAAPHDAALSPCVGVARGTTLYFCFPAWPHRPTLHSTHFCLCHRSARHGAPPPSPSIAVRVEDRVRHRPIITWHPVAAQVVDQWHQELPFTAPPPSST